MSQGIEFTLKNGSKDWYDPVDIPDGFVERDSEYYIDCGPYGYTLDKKEVESYIFYDLCPNCGRGLKEEGLCSYCTD